MYIFCATPCIYREDSIRLCREILYMWRVLHVPGEKTLKKIGSFFTVKPLPGHDIPPPDADFPWLTRDEVETLGIQLAQHLQIQTWPRLWQRREILREHLRTMDPPVDVQEEQWFTSTGPARWQGPVMTKTQKRRMQRQEADARSNGVTAQWLRSPKTRTTHALEPDYTGAPRQ